jgi:hypothetical protein
LFFSEGTGIALGIWHTDYINGLTNQREVNPVSEVDYLIKELEQRRSVINIEIKRIKVKASETGEVMPDHLKSRMKRLEDQRDWLNRSIEKLIYQSGNSVLGKSFFAH